MTMIEERYELCRDRIKEIAENAEVQESFREYFESTASLAKRIINAYELVGQGFFAHAPIAELRSANRALYEDIFSQHYETCYANPAYACKELGTDMGRLLSFLVAELRSMIPYPNTTKSTLNLVKQRIANINLLSVSGYTVSLILPPVPKVVNSAKVKFVQVSIDFFFIIETALSKFGLSILNTQGCFRRLPLICYYVGVGKRVRYERFT